MAQVALYVVILVCQCYWNSEIARSRSASAELVQQRLACNSCGSTHDQGEALPDLDKHKPDFTGIYCRLAQRRARHSQSAVNLVVSQPHKWSRSQLVCRAKLEALADVYASFRPSSRTTNGAFRHGSRTQVFSGGSAVVV